MTKINTLDDIANDIYITTKYQWTATIDGSLDKAYAGDTISFAFTGDYSLPNIVIPDGVEIIDEFAFDNCRSIRQIYFPNSVKYIGNAVVNGCSDLKSIYCYKSTEITNMTFSEKDKKY